MIIQVFLAVTIVAIIIVHAKVSRYSRLETNKQSGTFLSVSDS